MNVTKRRFARTYKPFHLFAIYSNNNEDIFYNNVLKKRPCLVVFCFDAQVVKSFISILFQKFTGTSCFLNDRLSSSCS